MADRQQFDREVSEKYVLALLTALANGPIGQILLELGEGKRRLVVRQSRDHEGWVVQSEAVE